MKGLPSLAALAALLCSSIASPGRAASPDEERLLGCGCEERQLRDYLPYSRSYSASGILHGALAEATSQAGVPAAAMVEALAALGAGIDLERELRDGDRFYVRYERTFTATGNPIGIGRVLWAELQSAAKGQVSIHRFRTGKANTESFWLATGQNTAAPEIRLPLGTVQVSSGFGMRADPFDQPVRVAGLPGGPAPNPLMPTAPAWKPVVKPTGGAKPQPSPWGAKSTGGSQLPPSLGLAKSTGGQPPPPSPSLVRSTGGSPPPPSPRLAKSTGGQPLPPSPWAAKPTGGPQLPPSPFTNPMINVPTDLGLRLGLAPTGPAVTTYQGFHGVMQMHEGVDLAADLGTPIRAAGDGLVIGAELKGGYGNWIEIEHEAGAPGAKAPKLATVYGHLSGFAPGIVPGAQVRQGDVIGYVGSTGRSTGPHLHFEILQNGRPTNPMISPTLRREPLRGGELARFKKQVQRDLQERQREAGSI